MYLIDVRPQRRCRSTKIRGSKYTDGPSISKSMQAATQYLQLDELVVIYPGNIEFLLDDKIRAVGLKIYLAPSS